MAAELDVVWAAQRWRYARTTEFSELTVTRDQLAVARYVTSISLKFTSIQKKMDHDTYTAVFWDNGTSPFFFSRKTAFLIGFRASIVAESYSFYLWIIETIVMVASQCRKHFNMFFSWLFSRRDTRPGTAAVQRKLNEELLRRYLLLGKLRQVWENERRVSFTSPCFLS